MLAKSSIILDVNPRDNETDMKEMETNVRSIEMDGLLWGAIKLVSVGHGIKKLQFCCVIEVDKVSLEELQEKIQAFEDFGQSDDIFQPWKDNSMLLQFGMPRHLYLGLGSKSLPHSSSVLLSAQQRRVESSHRPPTKHRALARIGIFL